MRHHLARSVVAVAIASLPIATANRLYTRQSEVAIWHAAAAHSPEKPRPWIQVGRLWAMRGETDRAAAAFARAIVLAERPERLAVEGRMRGHHVARVNLALLEADRGRYDAALALTAVVQPRRFGRDSFVTHVETQWRIAQSSSPHSP